MTAAAPKVLVVDDDPIVGKSIDRVLAERGYAVITAADGPEALDKIARGDYDVVYTDIKMPGMDGLEVASRIKASRPWLPVVIVTGYGSDANEAKAKEIGVNAFLRKPLSPETIDSSMAEALLATQPAVAPAVEPPEAAPTVVEHAWVGRLGRHARNVGLFFAAPFIGLAYAIAFPFIGLGLLAREGYRALADKEKRD
jgi:CheY-like chemotaxis protein